MFKTLSFSLKSKDCGTFAIAKVSINFTRYYFDSKTIRDRRMLVRRNRIKSLLFPQPEMITKIEVKASHHMHNAFENF